MSRPRQGMTVDEQLAADELALDLVAADTLIADLWAGRANIHQQRRAAKFLHQWMPRGMQGPPSPRPWEAFLDRVEAAIAEHGSEDAAYSAMAAEDKPGASAEQLAARVENIKRQLRGAKVKERQFVEDVKDARKNSFEQDDDLRSKKAAIYEAELEAARRTQISE